MQTHLYDKQPVTVAKREEVLYENSYGEYVLVGEKIDDDRLTVYYKVTGELVNSGSDHPAKVKYIFDNGYSVELQTNRGMEWFVDGDVKYMYHSVRINADEIGNPARIDFIDNHLEDNDKTFVLEDKGEVTIPGITMLPLNDYDNLNIVKESKDLNLNVHSIDLRDEKSITITATLEPLEDMKINLDGSCLINGIWKDCSSARTVELFKGIPLEIELKYDKSHFKHQTVQTGFVIAGFPIYFDLQAGEEIVNNTLYHRTQPYLTGYEDQHGERYYDAIQLQNESWSNHSIRGIGYNTLNFKVERTTQLGFWSRGDFVEFYVMGYEMQENDGKREEVTQILLHEKVPADEYEGKEYTIDIEGFHRLRFEGGYATPYLIISDIELK